MKSQLVPFDWRTLRTLFAKPQKQQFGIWAGAKGPGSKCRSIDRVQGSFKSDAVAAAAASYAFELIITFDSRKINIQRPQGED